MGRCRTGRAVIHAKKLRETARPVPSVPSTGARGSGHRRPSARPVCDIFLDRRDRTDAGACFSTVEVPPGSPIATSLAHGIPTLGGRVYPPRGRSFSAEELTGNPLLGRIAYRPIRTCDIR
jgi:hypothetical protein